MKVVMIGTGYVGLVSGACFAELGHHVVCVDKDKSKIDALNKGEIPIFEAQLEEIVRSNAEQGRISFTLDLKQALEGAKCVFLAVGTPAGKEDGAADLSYVFKAAEEIATSLDHDAIIVTKSTVPVGTGAKIKAIFAEHAPKLDCQIVSNPEFLREGVAVKDFMYPDRIVVGCESEQARHVMEKLYKGVVDRGARLRFTNIQTAELIKYASNAFLATKIAFINEMADICEATGADIKDVSRCMGLDNRIGRSYLLPGPGYGGSCFPKDTNALAYLSRQLEVPTKIVESVIDSNDRRKERMADKIIAACGGNVSGKTIAVLGLTFKANTDDMRYSPSLSIIPKLIEAGAAVKAYDPEGMKVARPLLPKEVDFCDGSMAAVADADSVVIVTEWDAFRVLDYANVAKAMKGKLIVDLRNILYREDIEDCGLEYVGIG